jgi:hypothetical protein
MTSCRRVAGLLEYAFGDLDDEGGCERVESHLRDCPGCRADVLLYRRIRSLAARLPPVPPPPRLLRRLKASQGETH